MQCVNYGTLKSKALYLTSIPHRLVCFQIAYAFLLFILCKNCVLIATGRVVRQDYFYFLFHKSCCCLLSCYSTSNRKNRQFRSLRLMY